MDQSSIQELAKYLVKEPVDVAGTDTMQIKTPFLATKNSKPANRYPETVYPPASRENVARLDNVSLPQIASPKQPRSLTNKADTIYCTEHP
jgi:hypothetical protein